MSETNFPMNTQTPIANIAAALAKAQKSISVADKNAKNETKGYRFADMESVVESCREALADQEISILQPLGGSATQLLVSTVLLHSSGEFLESEFQIIPKDPHDTDGVKSLITQMRRYSLMGMLCIATADDDGQKPAPKKPEKPKTVQDAGPVVESHKADAEKKEIQETINEHMKKDFIQTDETVTTEVTDDAWANLEVHVGSDNSPCKGKKLGELTLELRQWLAEKVVPTLGRTKKDKALAAAIAESVKHPETPATAPDTLPEPEKAVEPPPNAKETAPEKPAEPAPEPMEWRSVVAHNFKPNPKITLGEIADSAPDAIAKGYDGSKILRGMKAEGIAKIQSKPQTTKDKILVNAILAANEEMDARQYIVDRFALLDMDSQQATEFLTNGGILVDETLANASTSTLGFIRDQWSVIEKTIKEAKK